MINEITDTVVKKVRKGVWRMPRLTEAMKDVISCDKLRNQAYAVYAKKDVDGESGASQKADAESGVPIRLRPLVPAAGLPPQWE